MPCSRSACRPSVSSDRSTALMPRRAEVFSIAFRVSARMVLVSNKRRPIRVLLPSSTLPQVRKRSRPLSISGRCSGADMFIVPSISFENSVLLIGCSVRGGGNPPGPPGYSFCRLRNSPCGRGSPRLRQEHPTVPGYRRCHSTAGKPSRVVLLLPLRPPIHAQRDVRGVCGGGRGLSEPEGRVPQPPGAKAPRNAQSDPRFSTPQTPPNSTIRNSLPSCAAPSTPPRSGRPSASHRVR